jgi:nucleoid-associated protein YgaU
MANPINSEQSYSGVAQTVALGSATSVSSGAAKIFREFKWGLLTLVLLMAVVLCLIPKGKAKTDTAQTKPNTEGAVDIFSASSGDGAAVNAGINTAMTDPNTRATGTERTGAGNRADERANDPWPTDAVGNDQIARTNANGVIAPGMNQPSRTRGNGVGNGMNSHESPNAEDHTRTSRSAARTPESRDAGFKLYTVKAGDNLTKIASANLPGKGGMKAILDANKDVLPDANRLREGMKLKIPSSASAEVSHGGRTENAHIIAETERHRASSGGAQDEYVVQAGDTLERIARRVLNDANKWKDLMEWNKDRISDASRLKVGMVLRIHPSATPTSIINAPDGWRRNNSNTIRAGIESEAPPGEPQELNGEEAVIPYHPVNSHNPVSANRKVENPALETKARLPEPTDASTVK